MVGRSEELRRLSAAVIARRGVVIVGPAGVGKTTLALLALKLAEQRGMSLARATATRASRGLPFGALAPILPPEPDGDRLGRENHGDLLRRYGRAVVEAAGGHPLLLFVDDAHLLDDGSATLVHQLALARAATVLVTVRAGEPAPDPIVALWKDALGDRVEVGLLNDAEIEELLLSVLRGPLDAASVRELADRCRGNPLFLRELVTGALETGSLVEEGGLWRLVGGVQPTARLAELVALRLGELSVAEWSVLELLTLGEPLEQTELAQLADPAVLGALERRGLIASRLDGRRVELRLGHPVYGDVVRVGISALRERHLARSLADVIEARGRPQGPDSMLLASLRLIGGGGSPELFVAGSIAARARHDHSLAERLARAAIDDGAGFAARYVAAEAAHLQGRPEQAEHELAALAADAASDAEQAQVAMLRFDNAFFLRGRDADLRLIDDAAQAITDPIWRDELLTRRLLATGASSGPRAVVEAASNLLRRPSAGPLTAAHLPVSISLVRLGRLEDATDLLSPGPGGPATPAPDEPWEQWNLFGHRAAGMVYAGRLGEAQELLAQAYDLVIDQPAALPRASIARWLSILHLEQGRPVSAFRRASESYTLFQQLGHTYAARSPYGLAAHALSLAGRAELATRTLATLDALNLPTALQYEADIVQARAWTAAAAGHLSAARDRLEAAADSAEQIGDLIGATNALHGLARMGRAGHVATRLSALASEVDGDLVAARAAYANAVAAGDSTALDQVSGAFANLGANLYAAEAHAESAVILRRTGQARAATAAEHKAARLLTQCEGATTPPLASITARVNLTPGELDAAVQAATGRTNRQIASDMNLSVRTVESHLQRVYEKLGVSGRHELADALQDQPPA